MVIFVKKYPGIWCTNQISDNLWESPNVGVLFLDEEICPLWSNH